MDYENEPEDGRDDNMLSVEFNWVKKIENDIRRSTIS
jgi:hypothetical protein